MGRLSADEGIGSTSWTQVQEEAAMLRDLAPDQRGGTGNRDDRWVGSASIAAEHLYGLYSQPPLWVAHRPPANKRLRFLGAGGPGDQG